MYMDQKSRIKRNISSIINPKRVSNDELNRLQVFVDEFDTNDEVEEWLNEEWEKAENNGSQISFDLIRNKLNVAPQLENDKRIIRQGQKWLQQLSAAVVATIVLLAGWYVMDRWSQQEDRQIADNKDFQQVGLSGIQQVVFTSGGKCYNLSQNELSIKTDQVSINANKEELHLNNVSHQLTEPKKQEWNTLIVPKGQDYYVELVDGTKVWVNAGSKLTFPNYFKPGKRYVKLEGEAYFEVVSDITNPFFVETIHSQVRVTGTQFNVCSYADEAVNHITLVEGKVDVASDEQKFALKPGQQFLYDLSNSQKTLKEVDVNLYTSWRKGIYEFKDVTLGEIANRLDKWYNVEFVFTSDAVSELRFTGMVRKEYNIEYFLKVVEKTTNVQFSRYDSKIVVTEI